MVAVTSVVGVTRFGVVVAVLLFGAVGPGLFVAFDAGVVVIVTDDVDDACFALAWVPPPDVKRRTAVMLNARPTPAAKVNKAAQQLKLGLKLPSGSNGSTVSTPASGVSLAAGGAGG